MAADFDVVARLRLVTVGNPQRKLDRLSGSLSRLSTNTKTADSYMARFAKRALIIGGAYVGFHAMSNAIKGTVHSALEFEKEMQQTRIGLQTMVANIENMSFDQAANEVEGIWKKLTRISVETIATTKEIHEVFAGIYGPLRNAGASMETLFKATRNTVHAASALGVDIPQATRDIQLMAEGRAQAQVKLFTRLRATGFLKDAKGLAITAEAWNAMAGPERVRMLTEALAKFEQAGKAAEQSLPGRLSTFTDMIEQLRRAFFAPIFTKLADRLGKLNDFMMENQDRIASYLESWGDSLANVLDSLMGKLGNFLGAAANDLGKTAARIEAVAQQLGSVAKLAVQIALAIGGIKAATALAGAVGTAGSVIGSAVAPVATGAAMAYGGASAAAGGGFLGFLAGISELTVALTTLSTPLLAVLGLVGWVSVAWDELVQVFTNFAPIQLGIIDEIVAIATAIWDWLRPPLAFLTSILGGVMLSVIMSLGAAFKVLLTLIRKYGKYLLYLVPIYGAFILAIEMLGPSLEAATKALTQWLADFAAWLRDITGSHFGVVWGKEAKEEDPLEELTRLGYGGTRSDQYYNDERLDPKQFEKPDTTFDFRGSKITLKQEFRQADPDRIAIQMMKDIAKYSEQRVTSGFAPPLTG